MGLIGNRFAPSILESDPSTRSYTTVKDAIKTVAIKEEDVLQIRRLYSKNLIACPNKNSLPSNIFIGLNKVDSCCMALSISLIISTILIISFICLVPSYKTQIWLVASSNFLVACIMLPIIILISDTRRTVIFKRRKQQAKDAASDNITLDRLYELRRYIIKDHINLVKALCDLNIEYKGTPSYRNNNVHSANIKYKSKKSRKSLFKFKNNYKKLSKKQAGSSR